MILLLQLIIILITEVVLALITGFNNTLEGSLVGIGFTLGVGTLYVVNVLTTYLLKGNYKYSATEGSITILMSRRQKIFLQRNDETIQIEVVDDQVLVVSELGPGGETKTIPSSVRQKRIAFDIGKEFFWVRDSYDYYGTLYWNVENGWKLVN